MNRKTLQLFLTGLLALAALQPGSRPVSAAVRLQTDPPGEVSLENGYTITFDGVEYHPDNTATWRYTVERQPEAKSLAYWVLEIPACAPILSAGPGRWDRNRANPNVDIDGVRWSPHDEFDTVQFWVRLNSHGAAGTARLLAKAGPDSAAGEIAGPTCEPSGPGDVDQQAPTLAWLEPVAADGHYTLPAGGAVSLVVAAADNVAVARVSFLRWDEAAADYVHLADDDSAPYSVMVTANDLVLGWNFITAASYDAAGNHSDWQGIWIYLQEPSPAPTSLSVYLPLLIR